MRSRRDPPIADMPTPAPPGRCARPDAIAACSSCARAFRSCARCEALVRCLRTCAEACAAGVRRRRAWAVRPPPTRLSRMACRRRSRRQRLLGTAGRRSAAVSTAQPAERRRLPPPSACCPLMHRRLPRERALSPNERYRQKQPTRGPCWRSAPCCRSRARAIAKILVRCVRCPSAVTRGSCRQRPVRGRALAPRRFDPRARGARVPPWCGAGK